jgi:hypothetical protein
MAGFSALLHCRLLYAEDKLTFTTQTACFSVPPTLEQARHFAFPFLAFAYQQ